MRWRKRTRSLKQKLSPGKRSVPVPRRRIENVIAVKDPGSLKACWSYGARESFLFSLSESGRGQKREVRSMKTFEVQFRFRDRSEETVESTVTVEASSLPGAVAKAARGFVKGLDRKQRFDMNKNGLEITAKSAGTTTPEQAETSTEAAAG